MPVLATPVANPNPDTLPGEAYAQPKTTVLDDTPLVQKKQTVVVRDAQTKTVVWTMKTPDGLTVDLTEYGQGGGIIAPAVTLRVAEFLLPGNTFFSFTGSVSDAAAGQVQATVDVTTLGGPGIFDAEFDVLNTDNSIAFTNQFFLAVERSLFSAALGGPPSFAEIRLFLRDNAPAENRLLDTVQFDDAEIAAAMTMPIAYWNDALPPIAPATTQNFPYRYNWIQGTIAQLLLIAAEWYRRNKLTYAAGGIQVNDMDIADTCEQSGLRRWQEYTKWVQQRKVALNIDAGFGSLGSPYRFRSYGNAWSW